MRTASCQPAGDKFSKQTKKENSQIAIMLMGTEPISIYNLPGSVPIGIMAIWLLFFFGDNISTQSWVSLKGGGQPVASKPEISV